MYRKARLPVRWTVLIPRLKAPSFCWVPSRPLPREPYEKFPEHVQRLVRRYFPDRRQLIHQIELRSVSGTLRTESLKGDRTLDFDYLFDCLKRRQFGEVKRWASCNGGQARLVLEQLYDACDTHVTLETASTFIVTLADYEARIYTSNKPEIILAALCAELMTECEFK